jgi:hypothetical protein
MHACAHFGAMHHEPAPRRRVLRCNPPSQVVTEAIGVADVPSRWWNDGRCFTTGSKRDGWHTADHAAILEPKRS